MPFRCRSSTAFTQGCSPGIRRSLEGALQKSVWRLVQCAHALIGDDDGMHAKAMSAAAMPPMLRISVTPSRISSRGVSPLSTTKETHILEVPVLHFGDQRHSLWAIAYIQVVQFFDRYLVDGCTGLFGEAFDLIHQFTVPWPAGRYDRVVCPSAWPDHGCSSNDEGAFLGGCWWRKFFHAANLVELK